MAITTEAVLYGLSDAKLFPMTADTGSTPAYSTGLDCPGVSTLKLQAIVEAKENKGDGVIKNTAARITGYDFELAMSNLPLSLLPTLQGGAVTAAGTTPNQKQTYSITSASSVPSYFKVEAQIDPGEVGIGDIHMIAYKMKITDAPSIEANDAYGDYAKVVLKGKAIPCAGTGGQLVDIVINETKTAISA